MKVLYKGVDVSEMQGKIDWRAVKNAGIDFAILRCGYGQDQESQDDAAWAYNAAQCEALGIPYGAYFFCYAATPERAKGEARHALRLLAGKTLSFPVFYDMEYSSLQGDLTPREYAAVAEAFCVTLEKAGYFVGVYANLNWWDNRLTDAVFERYTRWVAQYYTVCEYAGSYGMWQYSSTGRVAGIEGNVDLNECFLDYPALIAALGKPTVKSAVSVASAAQKRYVVKAGDTLSEIALRYQTTDAALAKENGIADPNKIYVGQVIRIPDATPAATKSYHLGDHVRFSTCYASSADTADKAIPASKMLRDHGVITEILVGARNPYLLDNGLCWVNDGDIRGYYAE